MYYLIKQEKCGKCDGNGNAFYYERDKPEKRFSTPCTFCNVGYIETRVSADEWLLERLKSLQWNEGAYSNMTQQFHEPRFTDKEA